MDKKTKQLHNLLVQLQKQKFTHNYASNYYDKLNFRLIIPSITITGLSSITSFLASSNILPSEYRNYMNLSIGIFTSFSSIMQSIVSSCGFETRKETFKKAAMEYDGLISKVLFEIENPNEENFIDNLEKEVEKIKKNCNYLPPTWIIKKYEDKDIEANHENNIIVDETSKLINYKL